MQRPTVIRVLLVVLTLIAYGQVTTHEFIVLDDPIYVRDNDYVKRGLTTEGVIWAFTTGTDTNWFPMTWLSLMADAQLHKSFGFAMARVFEKDRDGLFPGAYHLTNMLLHGANVLLLFGLLHVLTGATWRSAFVAAIFAVHPMHVESVAWITERKDVLSMLFMLLAIRAYVFYVRDRDLAGYLKVVMWFALGLMSKSMLVTLPAALLLLDFWPLKRVPAGKNVSEFLRRVAPLAVEKLPLVVLSIVSAITIVFLQVYTSVRADGLRIAVSDRLENVAVSYVRYLGKLVWPVDLALLYPNPSYIGHEFWTIPQVLGATVVLLAITATVVFLGWRRRYLLVGWFWFLGTMTPVIGFVQIGRHAMADRYAYIPYLGLYVIIAWGVTDLTSRWKHRAVALAAAAAVGIGACSILTIRQVSTWHTSSTVYQHALASTKDNWVVHCGLGLVYFTEAGVRLNDGHEVESIEYHARGLEQLERAIAIYPDSDWLREHLANGYDRDGRLAEAQAQWNEAIRISPEQPRWYGSLALILAKRGRIDEAITQARHAVELDPTLAEAHFSLGMVLSETAALDEAIAEMEQSFALDPNLKRQHAGILARMKEVRDAEQP